MPNFVTYDPTSTPVPGIVTGRFRSFPEERVAELGPNALRIVGGIPDGPAKILDGTIVPLTQGEREQIMAAQAAAEQTAVRQAAKRIFGTPTDPQEHAIKLGFETVIELVTQQINALRTNAGMASITATQVKNAFKTTYEAKIDAL